MTLFSVRNKHNTPGVIGEGIDSGNGAALTFGSLGICLDGQVDILHFRMAGCGQRFVGRAH